VPVSLQELRSQIDSVDQEVLGLIDQLQAVNTQGIEPLSHALDLVQRLRPADLAAIDRLQRALDADDRIVELRASVDRTTRVRFREGAVTASESLDRTTEWLGAQFAQARHRVELAHAHARLLTTLGLEVR
jgi:outer membrane protein TolC